MNTLTELTDFIREFEACRLPKARWTHDAHLTAGFWYASHHAPAAALEIVRARIRAHNESVGTANTDSSGYHETITRLYVTAIAAHVEQHRHAPLLESLALLLASPLARSDWPLRYYSPERLFSVAARREWLEPDLAPDTHSLPTDGQISAGSLHRDTSR
jgi:hypothetical protein